MGIEIPRSTNVRGAVTTQGLPRISPGVAAQPGLAVGRIGRELERQAAVAEARKAEARTAMAAVEGKLRATRALNDLTLALENDPDFAAVPRRYGEGVAGIRGELEAIEDEAARAQVLADFERLAETRRVTLSRKALAGEVDATIASLDAGLPELAAQAAAAGSPLERERLIAQGTTAIFDLARTGVLSRVDAVARAQKFAGQVDEAEARRLIALDPEAAAEALLGSDAFPELDPVARARLADTALGRADALAKEQARQAEQAERDFDRQRAQEADDALEALYVADADGAITREMVEEARPLLNASQYASGLALLKPDPVADDPETFRELTALLQDKPDEVAEQAQRAHAAGLISNATLSTMTTAARAIGRQQGPKTEYEMSRRFLSESLDPGPLVQDPVGRARQAEALDVFDRYVRGPEGQGGRSDAQIRDRSRELLEQYSFVNLRDSLVGLPNPRFGVIPRDSGDIAAIDLAVTEAETVTAERLAAGLIDPSEAEQEARILNRWRKLLDQLRAQQGR